MRQWLYITAGPRAFTLACEHAVTCGGTRKNVIDTGIPSGKTMREQESLAANMQKQLADRLIGDNDINGVDITIFVEIGATAGALLVVVEALASIGTGYKVGAVVLNPNKFVAGTNPDVIQDIGLLGQAMWTYSLDGRLSWSMVTDGKSSGICLESYETPTQQKAFGSRLYGE